MKYDFALSKCNHCPGYKKCPAYRHINGRDYCVKEKRRKAK